MVAAVKELMGPPQKPRRRLLDAKPDPILKPLDGIEERDALLTRTEPKQWEFAFDRVHW